MRRIEPDDICLWQDGSWCYHKELEARLSSFGEDRNYEIVPKESPEWGDLVNN